MQKPLQKIISWLIRFVYLQLLVTLFSLPILVYWGIPLSLLSPIGNLIFTPFLTLFLFLSSLIFFLELLWLPNQWLIYLLECVTTIWTHLTHYGSNKYLVGFAQPPWWFFVFVIGSIIFIIHYKKLTSYAKRSILLCVVLLVSCTFLKLFCKQTAHDAIICKKGELTFIKTDSATILIDPGYVSAHSSAASWIEYTLVPELIKKYGITAIDHLVLLKPGIRIFEAFETLARTVTIKNCYCPLWSGTDPALNRSFITLKKTVEINGGILHRFGDKKKALLLAKTGLSIHTNFKKCEYRAITFFASCIEGCINKEKVKISSKV